MDIAQLIALPKTLDGAVDRLAYLLDPEATGAIAGTTKEAFVENKHFGLGLSIRNAFELHTGNPELLASCRTRHPDDASTLILAVLWDRLNTDWK